MREVAYAAAARSAEDSPDAQLVRCAAVALPDDSAAPAADGSPPEPDGSSAGAESVQADCLAAPRADDSAAPVESVPTESAADGSWAEAEPVPAGCLAAPRVDDPSAPVSGLVDRPAWVDYWEPDGRFAPE